MNSNAGSKIEVRMRKRRVVNGEVGGGIIGDEDRFSGKKSGKTGERPEKAEVGEREALRNDVVR